MMRYLRSLGVALAAIGLVSVTAMAIAPGQHGPLKLGTNACDLIQFLGIYDISTEDCEAKVMLAGCNTNSSGQCVCTAYVLTAEGHGCGSIPFGPNGPIWQIDAGPGF